MKTLKITGVRTILGTAKPVIVFQTTGGDVLRSPKLALIDMQNSGRALKLPVDCLDRGVGALHPAQREEFIYALHGCVGSTLEGEITDYKAGDQYAVRKGHPALTDPKHKDFGKVKKEGDLLVAEKDGRFIDGFLTIPLTQQERFMKESASAMATSMLAMFGFNAPSAPMSISQEIAQDVDHEDVTPSDEDLANLEAFGADTDVKTEPAVKAGK